MSKFLEPQLISTDTLIEKYAKGDETTKEEIYKRVAECIATAEMPHLQETYADLFYKNMINGAIGGGRIMAAAGTDLNVTFINCFVTPVGDSITGLDKNGYPGIYDALTMSAEILRRGGGVGYDFSEIRPKRALVKSVNSFASGPCSYIDIFDASCKTIESAGFRRGAQMGILSISHPDILEFITAKRTEGRWNNFNVSVFVTDEFMHAVENDGNWNLHHSAEPTQPVIDEGAFKIEGATNWVYKTIKARELWDVIMKSNYDYAEPGILFENTVNNDNNLRYCEYIKACNPCGEQFLPPHGCCDLGQIILPMFVTNPFTDNAQFSYSAFEEAVAIQVRFLDNVLDVTKWPLTQQYEEAMNKRRIGIGFTGLGNTLAMLNIRYDSKDAVKFTAGIGATMRNAAYNASVNLAREKGQFPLFKADKYLEEGTFASRLPDNIKDKIRTFGIRNSHLLSLAPTGTVSLAFADNASNGIEPPFELVYIRKKRNPDNTMKEYQVIDYGLKVWLSTIEEERADAILNALCEYKTTYKYLGEIFNVRGALPKSLVTAQELSADAHMTIPAAIAPYIDSAISKTINVPEDYSFEDFKLIYDKAFKLGLKGISTYRPNKIVGSILEVGKEATKSDFMTEKEVAELLKEPTPLLHSSTSIDDKNLDFLDRLIKRRPPRGLPSISLPVPYHSSDGNDKLYIILSFLGEQVTKDGITIQLTRPIEVFINNPPADLPIEWISGFARNLSLLARSGLSLFCKALSDNRKVRSDRGKVRYGHHVKSDGSKVPKFHDSLVGCVAFAIQELLQEKGIIDENGNPYSIENLFEKAPTKQYSFDALMDIDLAEHKKQVGKISDLPQVLSIDTGDELIVPNPNMKPGKKCGPCGAYAVIKVDGCERCTNCGELGACG